MYKLQWIFNQNTKLFIHKNAFENIVFEMAATATNVIWNINYVKHSDDLFMCYMSRFYIISTRLFPVIQSVHYDVIDQMETFSALLAICAGNSPVPGEFLAQRPVTRGFDFFFDLHLNKRLSKQSWGWWFETPSCSLWLHCNDTFNCSHI